MFDYETMRVIWWVITGAVATGFVLTVGFDFGIGALLPFIGRNDVERRVVINTIGPTWDGNQVWLILLGGAIFAVWPAVYATLFSGLYIAMLLVLYTLFFRPVGFDYRSKLESPQWRTAWDWGLFIGGAVPPVLMGVLVGNLLVGLPFHLDGSLRTFYDGSFWGLLTPFPLLCGVIGLLACVFHGAVYLGCRTERPIEQRARRVAAIGGVVLVLLMILAAAWVILGIPRPEILTMAGPNAPSNPMAKTVDFSGSWLGNFLAHPRLFVAPALAVLGVSAAAALAGSGRSAAAFAASAVGMGGLLWTVGFGLFPFMLISTTDPRSSLTIWDASASHLNLQWSLAITLMFLPIVLLYTRWAYRVIWGKVTAADIAKGDHTLY
ncbi:cytochrome d ubiquinol oxidase subunit II [Methylococcus capsulatus]|jgi:cytochrome d ubiquinol oxidase subunit II|uniref:cytochrome d ubiquinol oxidase subunit II n=1 Tax=Methylococcus capsulatus TaxID=414 RepID=UPI001C52FD25|nr:cytochrome d ubiquinol oxidase subunit II [Methylococcus capsulatus]QXP88163.1 cytochrome d ubiquinol oxidase subunit II [Methylococcus capsulatus]QXP94828.1 cytochrome d ubiquinol oxidase subunit II [Methylococcus capsulatus]